MFETVVMAPPLGGTVNFIKIAVELEAQI